MTRLIKRERAKRDGVFQVYLDGELLPTTRPGGSKSDKEWRDAIRATVHELRKAPNAKKVKALRLLTRRI
ncbi:MAG: hypothetical protein V3R27_09420 [Pseudomonadales bacterium]